MKALGCHGLGMAVDAFLGAKSCVYTPLIVEIGTCGVCFDRLIAGIVHTPFV